MVQVVQVEIRGVKRLVCLGQGIERPDRAALT